MLWSSAVLVLFSIVQISAYGLAPRSKNLCGLDEFPCENGLQCILKNKWCDSIEDCADDSDERYCARKAFGTHNINKCGAHHFECNDGPCIPINGKCDGYPSCADNSDEKNCVSASTHHLESKTTSKPPGIRTSRSATTRSTTTSTASTTKASTAHASTSTTLSSATESPGTVRHKPQTEKEKAETGHFATTISSPSHVVVFEKHVFPQHQPIQSSSFHDLLDLSKFADNRLRAMKWLLSQRDLDLGWKDTARAVVAIYLSDPDFFKIRTKDSALISNQLQLQLSMDLVRNQTKPIPLNDLSLYINALLATCNNPRNFHGIDLVKSLRDRTNLAQNKVVFVSPVVYLTLCAVGETVRQDIKTIQDFFIGKDSLISRLDTMALATLAASCINHLPKYYSSYIARDSSNRLLRQWNLNGKTRNIYSMALVAQALTASSTDGSLWKRSDVMDRIMAEQDDQGSFGDILSTYYVLPLLSGRTLASVQGHHCYDHHDNGLTPLEVLKNTKRHRIYVLYSLYFGDPVEVSHSLQLKVAEGTNFLDIMRLSEELNPIFRFKYDSYPHPPVVYSIGGVPNDAERGIYWSPHISSHNNRSNATSHVVPFTGDVSKLIPESGDDVIFWLKSVS